ncbi:magnesium/cobalt transporter CorA [Mumia sp. DW29H23]|uniref:magnesium/cobalt transporter CorA n=1 Tax=Mumia sp. DW29H23 TaxID=3421241 RepID=UPI003D682B8B
MILDCAAYRDEKAVHSSSSFDGLAEVAATLTGPADFVWVLLQDPTYEEFRELETVFGLHPLAVEDAVTAHQRPKIDVYKDSAFLVLRSLEYDKVSNEVLMSEVAMFIGAHYAITVRHGSWPQLDQIRDRADKQPDLVKYGSVSAAYHVVDAVVDEYQVIAEELTEDVEEVETAVFSQEPPASTARVYPLKRELLEFRKAVVPIHAPLQDLLGGRAKWSVPEGLLPYFRDIADHLVHARGTLDVLDGLLDNVMAARATQISVQQNDDMRKLAAYAAMFAAPTLVAGVYGMNFDDMPELHWALGYPMALLLMVGSVTVLWRLFKRSGWL